MFGHLIRIRVRRRDVLFELFKPIAVLLELLVFRGLIYSKFLLKRVFNGFLLIIHFKLLRLLLRRATGNILWVIILNVKIFHLIHHCGLTINGITSNCILKASKAFDILFNSCILTVEVLWL